MSFLVKIGEKEMNKLTLSGDGVDTFTEAFDKTMRAKDQLEQENEQLKEEIEQLKEANRDDICRMLKIEQKWIDTNEQLKEENERLKQLLQDWNIRFKE